MTAKPDIFTEPVTGVGLHPEVPQRPNRGIGQIIAQPDSPDLIEGVEIEPLVIWSDDRGFFTELFRPGQPGIARDFTTPVQVSAALSFAGTIKAFHYHQRQTDLWAPLKGMLQVALFDLRAGARTCGSINTLFVGEWRPWKLRIPPGVAHGYKVIGQEPAVLVYATNQLYDPDDEGRLSYDDPRIQYDWGIQHK